MVLGFGSKKKKSPTEPVFIRASPSLPELAQQRIPWPEDLVDIDSVHASGYPSPPSDGHGTVAGASKTSFQATRGPAISFHKPFVPGSPVSPQPNNSIASLYGSGAPPSSFNGVGSRSRAGSHPLVSRSTRRPKHPPTFNVMVAGAKQTGKSSLLRLLLDTSTVSSGNSSDQLLSLSTFHSSSVRPTCAINTACVEILQGPARLDDRVTLTCIDTPGLVFSEGKEFALDRAVSDLVKYINMQFAETMGEESKVVRTSKGDQHVHLCIYLIDPDSIMTPSARRARSKLAASAFRAQPLAPSDPPEPSEYDSGSDDDNEAAATNGDHDGRSEDEYGSPEPPPAPERAPLTPISPDDQTPRNSIDPDSLSKVVKSEQPEAPPAQNRLAMSPAEVRVIARLTKRVNVLPVIARADTLTDGRLERVKRAVRRDLEAVGTNDECEHGVFAVWDAEPGALFGRRGSGKENAKTKTKTTAGPVSNGHVQVDVDDAESDDERQSRPVIKLRDRGSSVRGLTRSRSRKSLRAAVGAEYDGVEPEPQTPHVASTAPSSPIHGHDNPLPGSQSRRTSVGSTYVSSSNSTMLSRAELRTRMPFAIIAPERQRDKDIQKAGSNQNGHAHGEAQAPDLSGRFVRRFRWGTVDVLDPQHCDFTALRIAVLGSYTRALKTSTRDVLYERFRTEKLLARRATRNISDEERKRLLQDLGL